MRFIVAAFFFATLAFAQTPSEPPKSGPVGLVAPTPGAPLSLEQVEQRTRKLPDGTSAIEIVKSKVYRDSAGRLRMESDAQDPSGTFSFASVADPVARSVFVLVIPMKLAGRIAAPKSRQDGFGFAFSGVEEALPPGKWTTKTEDLGKRTIEGIEFDGTRTTRASEEKPTLIAIDENWFSQELQLTGLATSSGPNGTHTAKIQNVIRKDPEPALFVIPLDYTIQEFGP